MQQDWFTRPRLVAGVMTGTSLDAVDVAIAEFSMTEGQPKMSSVKGYSSPFSPEERRGLQDLIGVPHSISVVNDYNVWIGHRIASVVRAACDEYGIVTAKLDAIGMHGQTVWHDPSEHSLHGTPIRATLQLGSHATLAVLLGTIAVGDFRSADVALGGQGAPLVPRFDADFLSDPYRNVIALNIGGMANLTLLQQGCSADHVRAFDTGPGNVWIDYAAERWFSMRYDRNGDIARSGTLHAELYSKLRALEFVYAPPPKSTGREYFSVQRLNELLAACSGNINPADIVHTLTLFTAWSIAENIRRYGWEHATLAVSGGGSNNLFLMDALQGELPQANVTTTDSLGIPSAWKESLCFAYLAYRTLGGLHSNVPSVTGAVRSTILGTIALPG